MSEDRHSEAQQRDLIEDPQQKALREAENGIIQYEKILELFNEAVQMGSDWKLRQRMITELQNAALQGIHPLAGTYRNSSIAISGSKHAPPDFLDVPEEVANLCDYVNKEWTNKTAIHLAAYVLWKLNWIHPFADGNGRTARAVSYLVLLVKLGTLLPGTQTIPEQIAANKGPYYDALEAADAASKNNEIVDVTAIEQMLENMLISQLTKKRNPVLPGTDRLKLVFENRIDKAPKDILKRLYGTEHVQEQLWTIGNSIILQVSSREEIDEADQRFMAFGEPFPYLIGDENAQEDVKINNSGRIIEGREFDLKDGYAISLEAGATIALARPSIKYLRGDQIENWRSAGTLYIVKPGLNITNENIDSPLDFMLARHFQESK